MIHRLIRVRVSASPSKAFGAIFIPSASDVPRTTEGLVIDIGHIIVPVEDMDRALAFYRDLLGFQVVGPPDPTWTVISVPAGQITLWRTDERERIGLESEGVRTPFDFHVRDFGKAADFVESNGVKVKRGSAHSGLVWDPFGNVLGLHDHRKLPQ